MGKQKRKSYRPGHLALIGSMLLLVLGLLGIVLLPRSPEPTVAPPVPKAPAMTPRPAPAAPTIRELSNRSVTISCGETLLLQQAIRYADHIIIDCAEPLALYYTLRIQRDISISGTHATTAVLDGRNALNPMIDIYGGAKLTLFNLHLTNSRQHGIHAQANSELTAIRCQFDHHGAYDGGAALWNAGGTVYMRNCLLRDNHSNGLTAGIYNGTDAVLTIENSIFRQNSISIHTDGMGAAVRNHGTATIENTIFIDNAAAYSRGAAVASLQGNLILTRTTFSGNYARWQGGAIYNGAQSDLTVHTSIFMDNRAANGTAIWNAGTLRIYGSDLTNNLIAGCYSDKQATLIDPAMTCARRYPPMMYSHR